MKKITIIGAGNAGKALAGVLKLKGLSVCLYNRSPERIRPLKNHLVSLKGLYTAQVSIDKLTTDLPEAINFSSLIIITTTNDAYSDLANKMVKLLMDDHVVVLFSSSLCGSLEFLHSAWRRDKSADFAIYEINNYIFLAREIKPGEVLISGRKKQMFLAKPKMCSEKKETLQFFLDVFPAIKRAKNIFETGLSSMNTIIHPPILATNIDEVTNRQKWFFYRDGVTQESLGLMEKIDNERIALSKHLGLELPNIFEYLKEIYPNARTKTLKGHFKFLTEGIYRDIPGPVSINHRMFAEDIPYGLVPLSDFGKIIGVNTPYIDKTINFFESKLRQNFHTGRNLRSFLPLLQKELAN